MLEDMAEGFTPLEEYEEMVSKSAKNKFKLFFSSIKNIVVFSCTRGANFFAAAVLN